MLVRKQDKYLKNELFIKWVTSENEEVNQCWENWIKVNPELAQEVKQSRELLRSMKFKEYKPTSDLISKSWDKVQNLTMEKERKVNLNVLLKIAAVIIFFISSFFIAKYVIDIGEPKSINKNQIALIEKRTEKGIKLTVQLSDGSKIKLNSDSKLIYPAVFATDKREVQLIGEGYFEIAHEQDRPFVVKSGNLVTTVLGTKFSINAFNKNNIRVALVSGSVKVEELDINSKVKDQNTLNLEPGFKAVFENNNLKKRKINDLIDLGWKDDIITFNNDNIDEIITKLENWYGVEFMLKDKQKIDKLFKGIYKQEILVNVLESIGHAMNFKFEMDGNTVYITGL